MVDSWYCLDQVGSEDRSQVSRRSEVGKHKRRSVFGWALLSNEYFMHFLPLCRGDFRTWWGEARNEVQAAFLTLILGRMHHRGTCRVLAQHTHTILRSAFGESIELCVRHRSVNYTAGTIVKRCNCIGMILCAILRYCRRTKRSEDVYDRPRRHTRRRLQVVIIRSVPKKMVGRSDYASS